MRFHAIYYKFCKQLTFVPIFGSLKNIHSYNFRCDQNFVKYLRIKAPHHVMICASLFHSSPQLNAKSHQEKENEYAHRVMEKIPAYSSSIVKSPLKPGNIVNSTGCPQELKEFAQVTIQSILQGMSLADGQFTPLVSKIVEILPSMSNENIIQCLHLLSCWPPTPKSWTPNFKFIWNNLDRECVRRLQTWDVQQKLLVADYWFQMRLNRISLYNRNMIMDMMDKLEKLTDTEIVQLMFYINLQRDIPVAHANALGSRLLSALKKISIKEVGIVCLGFFKTKNKVEDFSTIKAIIDRFINEIESIEQVTVVALLKFLKKSMQLSHADSYIPLLHRCVQQVPKWDVKPCIHLALLAAECHVYHPLLLDTVMKIVTQDIETARLKDCTKLLQCLAHFNHPSSSEFKVSLFSEIKSEKRKLEISDHPRDLVNACLFLAYTNEYNYDLLNFVMNPEFINKCVSLYPETDISFAEVDCCIEIECKDYNGYRLNREYWKVLNSRRYSFVRDINKPNFLNRVCREVLDSLQGMLDNKEDFSQKHILPHMHSPDIIVRIQGDPKFLLSKDPLLVPPQDGIWACFVMGVPFSFCHRSKHMTGVTAMKLRQLEKLGYKTIFLPYYELPRDSLQRNKLLKLKLDALKVCYK